MVKLYLQRVTFVVVVMQYLFDRAYLVVALSGCIIGIILLYREHALKLL